jgi:TetR/AcrR family transcriptional regulator, regulator of autoinduction and epiphytic fitness
MNTAKKSFRAEQFELREQAILTATNRLLGLKGYDAMAMDDIASEVGIAKGSLYKHFSSKDELAAAVMTNLLRRTKQKLEQLKDIADPLARIKAMVTWVLNERLQGGVPLLPSTSPVLQRALTNNSHYMNELISFSDSFGGLIVAAQEQSKIRRDLRQEFILFTIYARTCDPTLDFLKMQGQMSHEEIVQHIVDGCFGGLTT